MLRRIDELEIWKCVWEYKLKELTLSFTRKQVLSLRKMRQCLMNISIFKPGQIQRIISEKGRIVKLSVFYEIKGCGNRSQASPLPKFWDTHGNWS